MARSLQCGMLDTVPSDPAQLLDLIAIDREVAKRSFRGYAESAFPQVEPGVPFLSNWHIDAICDHMQAVFQGDIKDLVINVPPGSMKSLAVCTLYPTWAWTQDPGRRGIYASYSADLANRDSLRARQLIESPWYQERWGESAAEPEWRKIVHNKDQWAVQRFSNDRAGFRMATTVAGRLVGYHGHDLVVDDPIKPTECTDLALDRAREWWFRGMITRRLPGASRVVIMQRLHERDIAGLSIEAGFECLVIPMRAEKTLRTRTPLKVVDPRKTEGEPLWPARWSESELADLETELGPRQAAAQLQQRPAPADGAIFKANFLRYYKAAPALRRMRVMLSVDANFKATDNGSYGVIQTWGAIGGDFYLLDQLRDRYSFSALLAAVKRQAAKWRTASTILVEDKANGPAIISMLQKDLSGVIPCEPHGDKVQRANAVEPLWAAGNVWLPDESIAPWVRDFELELLAFPVGKHDDQVDAMSQALSYLKQRSMDKFIQAMAEAQKRL